MNTINSTTVAAMKTSEEGLPSWEIEVDRGYCSLYVSMCGRLVDGTETEIGEWAPGPMSLIETLYSSLDMGEDPSYRAFTDNLRSSFLELLERKLSIADRAYLNDISCEEMYRNLLHGNGAMNISVSRVRGLLLDLLLYVGRRSEYESIRLSSSLITNALSGNLLEERKYPRLMLALQAVSNSI